MVGGTGISVEGGGRARVSAASKGRERMKQLEEMNDLMKYQLILMKIHSALSKLNRLVKHKESLRLQRTFSHLKDILNKNAERSKARKLIESVRGTLRTTVRTREVREQALLLRFVHRWKDAAEKIKTTKDVNETIKTAEDKLRKELKAKSQSIIALEKKLQQQTEEKKELKKAENLLRQTLKDKEEHEGSIKEIMEKQKKRNSSKAGDNKVQALRTNLIRLENENRELRDKLEAAESNVDGFVREVNDLLDTHEFEGRVWVKVAANADESANGNREAEEARTSHSKSKSGTEKREAERTLNARALGSNYKV